MSGKKLQAIGTHGQDDLDEILQPRKATPAKSGRHRYCKRHSSYFCPCVAAHRYKKNDPRGNPALWDEAVEKRKAKDADRKAAAKAEYDERMAREESA